MTKQDIQNAAQAGLRAASAIVGAGAVIIVTVRPIQSGEPMSVATNVVNDRKAILTVMDEAGRILSAGETGGIIIPGRPS